MAVVAHFVPSIAVPHPDRAKARVHLSQWSLSRTRKARVTELYSGTQLSWTHFAAGAGSVTVFPSSFAQAASARWLARSLRQPNAANVYRSADGAAVGALHPLSFIRPTVKRAWSKIVVDWVARIVARGALLSSIPSTLIMASFLLAAS